METPEPSLENIQAQIAHLKSALELQKEIAAIRAEVNLQLSYFRWAAWTAGAILAVVGFFGVKAWNDLTGSAHKAFEKQIADMQDRYSNLSRGFSLVDSGRTRDAIPYLTPLYETNRYDEPVIRSFLYALVEIDDCDDGVRRVKEIRQDDARFLRIKDPQIFNLSGIVLRNCFPTDPAVIEEARKLFDLSLKRMSADDPDRRFSLYNLFSYHFLKGDFKTAETYLQNAATIREGFPQWEAVQADPWVKKLRAKNEASAAELKALFDRAVGKRGQKKPG